MTLGVEILAEPVIREGRSVVPPMRALRAACALNGMGVMGPLLLEFRGRQTNPGGGSSEVAAAGLRHNRHSGRRRLLAMTEDRRAQLNR